MEAHFHDPGRHLLQFPFKSLRLASHSPADDRRCWLLLLVSLLNGRRDYPVEEPGDIFLRQVILEIQENGLGSLFPKISTP